MRIRKLKRKLAMLLSTMLVISAFSALPERKTNAITTDQVTITAYGGDFETAYVTWSPVTGATSYKAYVARAEASFYTQLDDELIRSYGDYYRADAVGISEGGYILKVEAYNGTNLISSANTDIITVTAHDRSGYAFVNGTASGAYNEDGTLKSNAVVIYVTNDNLNTVKAYIDTAGKGTYTECTGILDILLALKKGYEKRPVAIRIIGNVTDAANINADKEFKGDWCISNGNSGVGITVEGIGNDAVANGWGIRIKSGSNIEIRNLGFMNCDSDEGDNVGLQQDNDHIWVHNCDMFYGDAGVDADQVKGDGALDCKLSTYVTFSYNHFWDNGKCNLLGLKEKTTSGYFITYHHNWYDHSDSRHPRVRYYSAHVYNNYYDGNAKYGVGATLGSSVFVEANYFRNCKYPMLTSLQGSDVYGGGTVRNLELGTFSKEAGGSIKAYNNIMVGNYTFIAYGATNYILKGSSKTYNLTGTTSTADFDAYVASTRDEKVPSTVISYSGSNTYNNFDTASDFYTYKVDDAADVPSIVTKWAGRAYGGDFAENTGFKFNNSTDDTSSEVNATLKAAVVGYTSKLVSVGGGAVTVSPTPTVSSANSTPTPTKSANATATPTPASGNPDNGQSAPAGTTVHNFTESGKTSSVFTINGNLSTSKGTVTYNGLKLTQCLKMESSTSVTFTTAASATLTLVLGNTTSTVTKIDGAGYNSENGMITVKLDAGSHSITKGGTDNLFYIQLVTEATAAPTAEPTATPTSEPTATPTSAVILTSTPAPTTDAQATATPVPTASASATATPAPTVTSGVTPTPASGSDPVATDTPVPTSDGTAPTKSPIVVPGIITATPVPTETPASTETPAAEVTATPILTDDASSVTPTDIPDDNSNSGSKTPVYIAITLVLALGAAGVIAYIFISSKKKKK